MTFTTQMDAARKGIVTPQMKDVLAAETITEEELLAGLADGRIVLPANRHHTALTGCAVGEGLKTKINVNLGVSEDCCHVEEELNKVRRAIEWRTDSIMDLSTFGDTRSFRRKTVEISPVMIGTVPMYDAVARHGKDVAALTVDELFAVVEMHAEDGVDFLTIHAGLNQVAAARVKNNPRITGVVSRGGSLLLYWMEKNERENPFFEHFDRLLEICRRYDVTLSLGDGLRPGCLNDATDAPQIQELLTLGELTVRCREQDVQVMIEGPGHVPLNEIVANVQLEKKLCHRAPFYVLGPLVTDVAPGYDHITSAIGGAIAAGAGADFLCYVTPAEHLRLPDMDDMREGIIATRIAAHAGDVARALPGAIDWDNAMSRARADLDWEKMIELALDNDKARRYRESSLPEDREVCTMCGDLCAVKRSREILKVVE